MKTSPSDLDIATKAVVFIAARYHVSIQDLEGHSRKWSLVWPRWLAINLVRGYTSLSLAKIGLLFDRNKSSIHEALSSFGRQIETSAPHAVETVHLLNAWESAIGD